MVKGVFRGINLTICAVPTFKEYVSRLRAQSQRGGTLENRNLYIWSEDVSSEFLDDLFSRSSSAEQNGQVNFKDSQRRVGISYIPIGDFDQPPKGIEAKIRININKLNINKFDQGIDESFYAAMIKILSYFINTYLDAVLINAAQRVIAQNGYKNVQYITSNSQEGTSS